MRNLLALAALLVAGCTTTGPGTINEPERTEYYFACISQNVQVTTCQCMEDKAVAATGTKAINDSDEATQQAFIKALQDALPVCLAEAKK